MADSDLQIRRGRSSRPWDGRDGLQKVFFRPFGRHFGLKVRGGGPLGPFRWSRQCSLVFYCNVARQSQIVRLRIFPWVVLSITGLQLQVICVPTFDLCSGHLMTVFCKMSVRRSKNCLEFSIAWGRLKIFRWLFHSCTIFEACLINSLRFFAFYSPD